MFGDLIRHASCTGRPRKTLQAPHALSLGRLPPSDLSQFTAVPAARSVFVPASSSLLRPTPRHRRR
jgi:hypothetical protein